MSRQLMITLPRTCARRRGCSNPDEVCLICPFAFGCPKCHADGGSPCRRRSGHSCDVHVARVEEADRVALRS